MATRSVPDPSADVSNRALWTGWVLSGLATLFLSMDGAMKLAKPAPVIEATAKLGYTESAMTAIGVLLLACTILYAIPRTAILGAVLLTGYLGGAVATHVRVGDPPFTMIFPVIVGTLVWGGLFLRDRRLKGIIG